MCGQLHGTQKLEFVPIYTLLFQVSEFARNTWAHQWEEQQTKGSSLLLEQVSVLAAGTNVIPENTGAAYDTRLFFCTMNMVQVWEGVCESDGQLGKENQILNLLRA